MIERKNVTLKCKDIQEASQRCANELSQLIAKLAQRQDQVVIALCGGSSPKALYAALVEAIGTLHESARSKLRFIPLDERCVADTHPDHNLAAINEMLLEPLARSGAIVSWQIAWYHQADDDTSAALTRFNDTFTSLGGNIDVVIAGVGPDGHIASLFPGLTATSDTASTSFQLVTNSPKPPAMRVTASRSLITDASVTVAIFCKGKEDAYQQFQTTHASAELDCPAKLLLQCTNTKATSPTLFVVTDIFQ